MTSLKTFLQFTLNFPTWAKMLLWPGYPLIEENQTNIHNTVNDYCQEISFSGFNQQRRNCNGSIKDKTHQNNLWSSNEENLPPTTDNKNLSVTVRHVLCSNLLDHAAPKSSILIGLVTFPRISSRSKFRS